MSREASFKAKVSSNDKFFLCPKLFLSDASGSVCSQQKWVMGSVGALRAQGEKEDSDPLNGLCFL